MDAHHIETRDGEINYQSRGGRETALRNAGGGGAGARTHVSREFFSVYLAAPVRNRVSNYCNALTLSREKGWGCHFFPSPPPDVRPDEEGATSSVALACWTCQTCPRERINDIMQI